MQCTCAKWPVSLYSGGGEKGRALKAYLRAECGLLVEVAPHEVTVLPGGDFTPKGSCQGLEGAHRCMGTYPIYPRQISAPPTSTGPVLSPGCWNQIIAGFSEGEER